MGSPFLESSEDLLVLDTKDIADPAVVKTVREIEQIGEKIYAEFVQERLENKDKSVFDPIPKNQLRLFKWPSKKQSSKSLLQVQSLKSDRSLFSRLFIACQNR